MATWQGGRQKRGLKRDRGRRSSEAQYFEHRRQIGAVARPPGEARHLAALVGVETTHRAFYLRHSGSGGARDAPPAVAAAARRPARRRPSRTTSRDLDDLRLVARASAVRRAPSTTLPAEKQQPIAAAAARSGDAPLASTPASAADPHPQRQLDVHPRVRYFNDAREVTNVVVADDRAAAAEEEAIERKTSEVVFVTLDIDDVHGGDGGEGCGCARGELCDACGQFEY